MYLNERQIAEIKQKIEADAAEAFRKYQEQPDSPEWVDPMLWKQYCGHKIGNILYSHYSNQELLGKLREAAERLGKPPGKKDVFCVYRVFILRRFEKWPWALVAARLKRPRKERLQEIAEKIERKKANETSQDM